MTDESAGHVPVLVEEVLELLSPAPAQTVLDCTIGRGGHAAAIIPRLGPGGRYVGIDLDPANINFAARRLQPIADEHRVDLTVMQASFAEARAVLDAVNIQRADALLADLGFASTQVDDPQRGLSFGAEGPLDMRLDPASATTAAELVNRLGERELADLIYQFGEEPMSRKIARKIVERRRREPIQTTSQLAQAVRAAYGPRAKRSRLDPATRTFMALRIAVNEELAALEALLESLAELLAAEGRAAVISFHSLEDRRVKHACADLERQGLGRRLTKKPLTAGENELAKNPRSRSAKLRAFAFGQEQ